MAFKNNHFSNLLLCFVLFLVTVKLQLVGNYIHKMVIKFVFCAVSLLWAPRYVLIDYTHLRHFLCCNLFVMLCWITSVISTNVLEIRLPITSVKLFLNSTDGQLHHKYCCSHVLSRFSRLFSKLAWVTLLFWFLWGLLPILPTFMGYHMGVSGCFSEFCKSSQNSRGPPMHMAFFP